MDDSIPVNDLQLSNMTITPMSYRDRITVELILNGTSWIVASFLLLFVRMKRGIWQSLRSTIVFVTTGSFLLNIPLLLFQSWMVLHLQLSIQPKYSILICSLLKNLCSSTTSAYQVLPFAVSLYRYRTVVLKGHPSHHFVIYVHTVVTVVFIFYAFLNFPLGSNTRNDVCYVLRFSNPMELVRIISTLFFNICAITVNCVILRFVRSFESSSKNIQSKRVQLTQSLLIQSVIPVLVSFPLLLGSFEFYFGVPLPPSIGSTWYATTFLGPFLMPLSSILGIKSTRSELFNTISCNLCKKAPNRKATTVITVIMHHSKPDRSTFTVKDDD